MDLVVLFVAFLFILYGKVEGQSACAPTWYVSLIAWLHSTIHLNY